MMTGTTCAECGADSEHFIELDDGTLYCPIHRGPASTVTAGPPDVGHLLPDAEHWNDATGAIVTHDDVRPVSGLSVNTADPTAAEPHEAAESVSEDVSGTAGPNMDALKLLIGLAIRAGLMSLTEDNEPVEPPTGWAPPGTAPEVEGAVGLAVALMIRTFGIDHDDVRALAEPFLNTDNETEHP